MANKAFEIQNSTLRIGGVDLQAGNNSIVIPGVTQAVNYFVEEIDDQDGSNPDTFGSDPDAITVIDNAEYLYRSGIETPSNSYSPAGYSVDELDDGEIDKINIEAVGIFLDSDNLLAVRDNMWATTVADPFINFNASNWTQIPFKPNMRAGQVDNVGGGADLGDFTINGDELSADQMTIKTNDGDINIESDTHVYIRSAGGSKQWSFANDGILTLPENGDIVDFNGSSVLGGGGSSNRLVNGLNEVVLNSSGNLTIPGSIIGASSINIDNRTTGNSADINLYAADDINLLARDRSPGSTSEGGDINIHAGDSADDADSSGGDVVIEAGNGGAANVDYGGSGGFIRIQTGRGGAASTIEGGESARGGGELTLRAGDAGSNMGNINRGAGGGAVVIEAGDSTGNLIVGGSINLRTGTGGPNAAAGAVIIDIPSSDQGPGGEWIFNSQGELQLPGGGDIVDSSGNSVLGTGTGTVNRARGPSSTAWPVLSSDENADTITVSGDRTEQFVVGVSVWSSVSPEFIPEYFFVVNNVEYVEEFDQTVITLGDSIGSTVYTGSQLYSVIEFENFTDILPGDNIAFAFVNDSLVINSTGGSGSGLTIITPEEIEVPGVTTLAFVGDGVSVDRINDVTTVTIPGGGSGSSTVIRQDTAPTADNGTLWFNTVEARLYIKYEGQWIDSSPVIIPPPQTELNVNSITFSDASVLTSVADLTSELTPDRLVNGDNELILGTDGTVTFPSGNLSISSIQDFETIQASANTNIGILAQGETGSIALLWSEEGINPEQGTNTAAVIVNGEGPDAGAVQIWTGATGPEINVWKFNPDGSLKFPGQPNYSIGESEPGLVVSSEIGFAVVTNSEAESAKNWLFGTDGVLTLPAGGDIEYSNGVSVITPQGEYVHEFTGLNTELTLVNITFNLLYCKQATGYSGSDLHNVNLSAGRPGQRLVVINSSNLNALAINNVWAITSGTPAEFIYSVADGEWAPLYGATFIP